MSLAEYGYEITDKDVNETWEPWEYKILHDGTGTGTFAPDSSQAAIAYICEYYYHEKFIDVVIGKTVKVGSQLRRSASAPSFDDLNGSIPEEHPYYFNFFASSVSVEPLGKSSQDPFIGPLWPKAKITVVFRPPTYNVIPDDEYAGSTEIDRFVTRQYDGQAEFQTSMGFFKFVPGGRVLDITPGQTVSATKYLYTWHQIPVLTRPDGRPDLGTPPVVGVVDSLVGSVNEVEFDGYPPGTCLFIAPGPMKLVLPQVATQDNYYWNLSYVIGIRNYGSSSTPVVPGEHRGWNYAYDPLASQWKLFTTDGTTTGATLYPYADLNDLFVVSW